jgi:hypothetical protein
MTFSLALAGVLFLASPPLTAADKLDLVQRALDAWEHVQLTALRLTATVSRGEARLSLRCELRADEQLESVILAFPVPAGGPFEGDVTAACDGQPLGRLAPVSTHRPPGRSGSRSAAGPPWLEGLGLGELNSCFDAFLGASTAVQCEFLWHLYETNFMDKAARVVQVEARVPPRALTDCDHGPCYAFVLPLRLGRFYAGPAGKLEAAVTLADDLQPEDVLWTRPPGVKREGRKFTFTADDAVPLEDLVLVVKGKPPAAPMPKQEAGK